MILFNLSLDEPLDERNSTEEGGRGVPLPLRSPPSEKSSKVQHLDRFLQSILVDEDREREEEREERRRGRREREGRRVEEKPSDS